MEEHKENINLFGGIQPPHLAFYREAIRFNLESAIYSVEYFVEALNESDSAEKRDETTGFILDAIQNMLVHTANLSKYFWPINKGLHKIHKKRAQSLREMFNIKDSSLIKNKDLRNHLEHLDENLDKYLWSKSIVGNIHPAYVGTEMARDGVPYHFFRAYFTDAGIFESLGLRFEIQPIVGELYNIYRDNFNQ